MSKRKRKLRRLEELDEAGLDFMMNALAVGLDHVTDNLGLERMSAAVIVWDAGRRCAFSLGDSPRHVAIRELRAYAEHLEKLPAATAAAMATPTPEEPTP